MTNVNTWNQENKDKWIAIMQEHQNADRLIQGSWFSTETKKGCFFGCAMQTDEDALTVAIIEMCLPPWLIHLAEKIFEGLSKKEALTFPVKLLKAIPVDADIEKVKHESAIIRLTKLAKMVNNQQVIDAINLVIECHKKAVKGDNNIAWSAAELAAESAAELAARLSVRSAAWSAAWSAARLSVRSAARSAAESADSARSAARSAAESAAESAAAWSEEAENLINLLQGLSSKSD